MLKRHHILNANIKILIAILLLIFLRGNIVCNDGTISPSCSDCHSGCCSHHGGCSSDYNTNKNNHYNSTKNNYHKKNEDENDNDFTVWIVIAILGIPIIIFLIREEKNQNASFTSITKKSDYELFCERLRDVKSRIDTRKNTILNDSGIKYDKISFKYNNQKISAIFYSKNEVEKYYSRNSHQMQFRTIGRKITIQNLSENETVYYLYQNKFFDYNMRAIFYASNVKIYDLNRNIRELYNFKTDKRSTKNLARTKKKISSAKKYIFKIVIKNINYSDDLEVEMNLDELIKFSKLCQSIEIIEKAD